MCGWLSPGGGGPVLQNGKGDAVGLFGYNLVGAAGSANSLKSISAYLDPRSDRIEANRGEVCAACGGSGVITPAATRS